MKLTYFGHSCFSVEVGGKTLLFDPFIRGNELAASVVVEDVAADYLLISHGHFDHMADAIEIAKRTGAKVITNFEIYSWLVKQGIENVHPMNLGGAFAFEFGTVKMVAAVHSSVLPDGTYAGNPGGFVIQSPGGTFYYSGDTALTMDMGLLAAQFQLDFAVLPIGDNFTMGVADAIRAAGLAGTSRVVGVHYDTFPPIRIDHQAAQAAFKEAGLTLLLPAIGASVNMKE